MSSSTFPTYRERLERRLQNRPALVWGGLALAALTTIAGAFATVRPLVEEALAPPPAALLDMTMLPGAAVRNAGGGIWDGGSQALFIETEQNLAAPSSLGGEEPTRRDIARMFGRDFADMWSPPPAADPSRDDPAAHGERLLFAVERLHETGGIDRVWEAFYKPLKIDVLLTYDAPADAPTAIVLEWGVEMTRLPVPERGTMLAYDTGGAAIARIGGNASVAARPGRYPVVTWSDEVEGEERTTRAMPAPYQSLRPGEPMHLALHVTFDPGEVREPDILTLEPQAAFALTAYARVRIRGEESEIHSPKAVRVVVPDGEGQWQKVPSNNLMERLRPDAYGPVPPVPDA